MKEFIIKENALLSELYSKNLQILDFMSKIEKLEKELQELKEKTKEE